MFFILYMLTGATAGILSGMLGIGGGVIIIPFLIWIYKMQHMSAQLIMHMATGTSLAIIVLNTTSALYAHLKKKIKILFIYKKLFPGIILGTIAGAILSHFLRGSVLEIIFCIFLFIVSLRMLLANKQRPGRSLPNKFITSPVSFLIGAKSGMLGLGGGAITIPFLHYCNVPIRNIIAISSACSLTIASIGTVSFMIIGSFSHNLPNFSTGYIFWPAFLGAIITGPLCAKIGTKFSHKLPQKTLKKILAIVLLLTAIKILLQL